MISIPQDKKWSITNSGEVFGTLYSTKNINFDEEGYAAVSPKSVSLYSSSTNEDFGLPLAIQYFDDVYNIVTNDGVFTVSSSGGASLVFDEVASTPTLGSGTDAVAWQNRLYVSADEALYYLGTNGSWSAALGSLTLTANKAHPIAVFENKRRLCVANNNIVYSLNTSDAEVSADRLTIPADYEITSLRWRQNYLYIGTKAVNGGEAKMFLWNGSGTEAQQAFGSGANWIFALEEYDSSMYIVTNTGQLKRFNGGGFDVKANFPVYHSPYSWTNDVSGMGRVRNRGIRADGDVLYINIDGSIARPLTLNAVTDPDCFFLPQQPSGVWCYDPKVGLYCRNLSTKDAITSVNVSSMSDSTLTLASAINAQTGEPVLVTENGSLTGVSDNITYFAIRVSSTEYKLSVTAADAHAGTAITLGGSAGSAALKVVTYNDYGELFSFGGAAGAIEVVSFDDSDPPTFPDMFKTRYIWGVEVEDGTKHLNGLSLAYNVGSLTTNKIFASDVKESFTNLFVKNADINLDTEKIVVRHRANEVYGLPTPPVYGTFSNDSTIGSNSALLGQVAVGHSLTILSGNGAGRTFKITEINGDEYVLDEAVDVANAGDAVVFYVRNYEKSGVVTDDQVQKVVVGPSTSSWLQTEVELRGQKVKLEELQLSTNKNQQGA